MSDALAFVILGATLFALGVFCGVSIMRLIAMLEAEHE